MASGGKCDRCQRSISPEKLRLDASCALTSNQVRSLQTNASVKTDSEYQATRKLIGRRFGHFEIIEPLGHGGMGQVFRALDHSLHRYVAVKILRRGKTQNDAHQIDLLLQEAIAQARVNHPNVATIFYVERNSEDPFLAMELVDGGTLASKFKDQRPTFSRIVRIALQIVDALRVSHQFDIIHGDIKPTNLLISSADEIKLSDFGMARSASKEESQVGMGGTPNYLAPELLHGQSPSLQSDMYALGVSLYELTFGRLPVQLSGSTIPQWIDSHANTVKVSFPDPWPEDLPEGWRTLLQRLLHKDPAKRFDSYEQIENELRALQPTSNMPARRTPRLVAGMIDYGIVLLIFLVVSSPLIFLNSVRAFFEVHWLVGSLARLVGFLPILFYSLMVFTWRQSLGHSLMHLRVVNRYGLPATQRVLLLRSIGRMMPFWILALLMVLGNEGVFWSFLISGFQAFALLWLLVDISILLVLGNGRSLHDLIFKTRVVLGES